MKLHHAFLLLPLLSFFVTTAHGQGFPPSEAADRMTVPGDVQVERVANEPLIRQPVAIDFDDRGRLWVLQYMQYPNPEGLRRARVDRYSRTSYDRVPEPPPAGPRGSDKLTILFDDNHDGIADRTHDFLDGLNLASGFVHGRGGVFVLQVPYLLFYADRDQDDVPDGPPQVLLTGFGMEDAHSVANSLTWGPDGWLYGLQGSTVTAKIRGIEFQQGVWRYHVAQDRFELFAEGGGNMWGLDFNDAGQLITSTNLGGFTCMHAVPGGYYWKSFGKHGPLHNPYTFGYFDHIPCEAFHGGHVSVGGLLYRESLLPAYRGKYIYGNLLSHGIYQQSLFREGSSFRADRPEEWIQSNDTWFAPTDLCIGPDGAVYVADWHDRRTAHPDPDADWDKTNGRVYRIVPKGSRQPTLALMNNDEDLLQALLGSSHWHAWRALRLLAEEKPARIKEKLAPILYSQKSERVARLRILWLFQQCEWLENAEIATLCGDNDEEIRAWLVRWISDRKAEPSSLTTTFAELARKEKSPRVRCAFASALRRMRGADAYDLIDALLHGIPADDHDPHFSLLLWWGIETQATADLAATVQQALNRDWINHPRFTPFYLTRLAKRVAADPRPDGLVLYHKLLLAARPETIDDVLTAFCEAQELRPAAGPGSDQMFERFASREAQAVSQTPDKTNLPPELRETVAQLWKQDPTNPARIRAALELGMAEAISSVSAQAIDQTASVPVRVEAIQRLARHGSPPLQSLGESLLAPDQPVEIQQAALGLGARFGDDAWGERLLVGYSQRTETMQQAIRSTLTTRPSWIKVFLREVDEGRIKASTISVDDIRPMLAHQDERIQSLILKHWGAIRAGTPEEKLAEVRRLNNNLNAGKGDAHAGHGLFTKHCAGCHALYGEGAKVGPDLTHANRTDREFLLVSLVDPSLTIRKEYVSLVCELTDGRVLRGVATEQRDESVTLVDSSARPTKIARREIAELRESSQSVMPDDLYRRFSPQELRDLFAYLAGPPAAASR